MFVSKNMNKQKRNPLVIICLLLISSMILLLNSNYAHAKTCTENSTASCYIKQAKIHLENNDHEKALAISKQGLSLHPDSKAISLSLAKSYIASDNLFWSQKTLLEYLQKHPEDYDTLYWLALVMVLQGELEQAREILEDSDPRENSLLLARKYLLLALVARNGDNTKEAITKIKQAAKQDRAYKEDAKAIRVLRQALDPWYVVPFRGKLELAAGYTTNAGAGSSIDPSKTSSASPLIKLSAFLQFVPPTDYFIHPLFEIESNISLFTSKAGLDYSYINLPFRAGVLIGNSSQSVLAVYKFDALMLKGGDKYEEGPIWYYNLHRGELEIKALPMLSFFGGVGQRTYRVSGKSRIEADGGVVSGGMVTNRLQLMGAATFRFRKANKDSYNLLGGSAIFSAEYMFDKGWSLNAVQIASLDFYPDSKGYFDSIKPDSNRRDILLKTSGSVWSPVYYGVRAGFTYEFSDRLSTANPYDYIDHRFFITIKCTFKADPWTAKAVDIEDHVSMPVKAEGGEIGLMDRIQELLKQNEAVQRGSSCMD